MSTTKIIIAGFGGQGILFTGKLMTYQGLLDGKYVSWLPSYGPEVRGGTCNCSVIISDEPIGSPIIDNPDIVIAMNRPSLDKYEPRVAKGGKLFVESSLIDRKAERTDITVYYVPATEIKVISARHRDLLDINMKILAAGYSGGQAAASRFA